MFPALVDILTDKQKFIKLFDMFPEIVKKTLSVFVWEGGDHEIEALQKKLGTKIISITRKNYKYPDKLELVHSFFIFQIRNYYSWSGSLNLKNVYLYLPEFLRTQLKQYLKPPSFYNFIPLATLEKPSLLFQDKDQFLHKFQLICTYIQQGNLKYSKSGDQILVSSIRQMGQYCDIEEYYNTKDALSGLIRTRLTAEFLSTAYLKKDMDGSPEFLKELIHGFFRYTNCKTFYLKELLFHLKGIKFDEDDTLKMEVMARNSLWEIFKNIPFDKWISLENLVNFAYYRNYSLDVLGRPYYS